ncbi:glycosyltransferase family 9 protein [Thermogemmatispora sp.]|uniref:glycosyltransferase family 9 protein n=1 Tax=Thermogemmatispora sp. TaxID=1968838 RepID=UPI0035E41158
MSNGDHLFGEELKRIAVVRALYLGDLLLAVPALRALRQRFPKAEITLIGLPWARSFARRYRAYVDRFACFPGYPGIAERAWTAHSSAGLARLRRLRFDLAIQLHGSGQASNPFVLALGARYAVGYYDPTVGERPTALTLAAPYPHEAHEIWRNLGLIALLGGRADDPRLEFPLTACERKAAAALLAPLQPGQRPLIGLHAGARAPARRWPATSFATLARLLMRHYEAQIVLTGSADERSIVQKVSEALPRPVLNLAGRTRLGTLAAVLSQLDLFISNDTGVAHLACALGVPSITLFGPADPRRWAPLDRSRHLVARLPVACSPCPYSICPLDQRCLRWLAPSAILALAERLLAARRTGG